MVIDAEQWARDYPYPGNHIVRKPFPLPTTHPIYPDQARVFPSTSTAVTVESGFSDGFNEGFGT